MSRKNVFQPLVEFGAERTKVTIDSRALYNPLRFSYAVIIGFGAFWFFPIFVSFVQAYEDNHIYHRPAAFGGAVLVSVFCMGFWAFLSASLLYASRTAASRYTLVLDREQNRYELAVRYPFGTQRKTGALHDIKGFTSCTRHWVSVRGRRNFEFTTPALCFDTPSGTHEAFKYTTGFYRGTTFHRNEAGQLEALEELATVLNEFLHGSLPANAGPAGHPRASADT